jgi:hypothetical protein
LGKNSAELLKKIRKICVGLGNFKKHSVINGKQKRSVFVYNGRCQLKCTCYDDDVEMKGSLQDVLESYEEALSSGARRGTI